MIDTDWSEHYIKRGDPTKPTYYIIRRTGTCGLFYHYNMIMGHIRYALTKDFLPVVDMQNYPNAYLAPEKLGKENSWEYYFEQPLRINLEDAYNGENVILNDIKKTFFSSPHDKFFYEHHNNILTEWRMLVKLGLLKVKTARMEEIATVRQKLFAPNDRVLGVLLRGTDYVAIRPKWHPIPPPVEFALSIIVEKLREWQYNKIYLATEDKNIVQIFKQVFGNVCITFDKAFLDYNPDNWVSAQRIDRDNDHFLQGKEYLTEILLLSTCNSLVAARCSGTVGAMMMADNFEHTYVFNLGRYGVIGLD